jgi:hypothetical protein
MTTTNKLKNEIQESPWIYLYVKLRPNTRSYILDFLLGFGLSYIMEQVQLLDEHERNCAFLGICISMIGFAFIFGAINILTGRDIRLIATRNMVEPSELKQLAGEVFK